MFTTARDLCRGCEATTTLIRIPTLEVAPHLRPVNRIRSVMADIAHQWGSDLEFGPNGDLAVVAGSDLGQQRVLRRLLTNLLDYIWQPAYGAGLAGLIGQPANILQIRAT